jgi:transcriptional regulator with XRE-family HTH domain
MGSAPGLVYRRGMAARTPVGNLLREWRQRRRKSQLALACDADISTRHLSFIETGRATPSREMLLHLAERLEVPLRERNVLLTAAGYAPRFEERPLADAALSAARRAVDVVLAAQLPFLAFALDRHWNIVASNRALPELYVDVVPALLQPPVNAIRLSLHPDGLAPRIRNLAEWRAHLLARLAHQIELTADEGLVALHREASDYPAPPGARVLGSAAVATAVLVPLRIEIARGVLSFLSTTTVFGTPVDVTLSELAIESFFPADTATAELVRELVAARDRAETALPAK